MVEVEMIEEDVFGFDVVIGMFYGYWKDFLNFFVFVVNGKFNVFVSFCDVFNIKCEMKLLV